MRAAIIPSFDGPSCVTVAEVAEPVPSLDEVLIDVEYAGVVFPDLLQTRGQYQFRPDLPFIPGWEVAGTVRRTAGGFSAGARVAAMPVIGGFAESVAVPASMVFPVPEGVSLKSASGLPLNMLTAHLALVRRGHVQPGEIVLIHGAAGGVGTATCRLARALGATVVAVVSSDEKAIVALRAGAHHAVLADGFKESLRDITPGRGVDVVVDPVGGDRFTDSLRALAPEGRVLVVGFTGREIPTVKVNRLLLTNTSVVGVATNELWRQRPELPREQWDALLPLISTGALEPLVGDVFTLDQVGEVLAALDDRRALGKLLIRVR